MIDSDQLERWEYRVEVYDFDVTGNPASHARRMQAALNELGAEGWELVAVTVRSHYEREYSECSLKRRVTNLAANE